MKKGCFLTFILVCSVSGDALNTYRLELILNALNDGLQYMREHITEINLDGVFGTRLVEEQLEAYLRFEPEVFRPIRPQVESLRDKAANVSDEGEKYVRKNDKEYTGTVGRVMNRSLRLLWYPSRETDRNYVLSPVSCSNSIFNENNSDVCLMQIVGSRKHKQESCSTTAKCMRLNRIPKQRGYVITHQVLFWQLLEMRNCGQNVSPDLMISLCSNVMRDAEEIVEAEFPLNHQDLFMEQIGLCGIWGFKDFYKPEWLEKILQWQQPSGCFTFRAKWKCIDHLVPDGKIRTKRREKILEDGCLSHKTAVGLLAITVSLRFEAERLYNDQLKEYN